MEKTWIKDVKEGEKVKSLFLVAKKATPTSKSGKTYLAVTLHDKTGELEARAFDKLEELVPLFEEQDYVEVEGLIGTFQGKPQLRIETLVKADAAALDAAEFLYAAPPEPKKPEQVSAPAGDEQAWTELLALADAVTDQHIKALIASFLGDEDFAARLRRAPAAKSVHHAYAGGLLEHTVAVMKLAHRLADQYPQVDRDLLVAGAFLHDLGKVRELAGDRNAEYTDEGKLVGHLVMAAQWIHDKARRVGMPRELEHHVVHLVLAHHGKLEYGSPKVPQTLEALLTHYLDEIDSRINSWLNLMGRESGHRRWTDTNNVYSQSIWRGALPTVQAEKKGPPPEVMTPVIYVPRGSGGGGGGGGGGGAPGGGAKRKSEKKPRPQQPARPERKPAERPVAAEGGAETAPAPAAVSAPPAPRAERSDRPPDRGQRGSFGRPGDKTKGYTGPRQPGDKGPHRPPGDKKGLTHSPFAALAAKLGDPAKPAEATEPAAAPAEASEPAPAPVEASEPAAPAAAPEAPSAGEGTPAQ
jgi:3'-5' exoribonuclease